MSFSFDDEKLLREARKRDFMRSRLPAGKRWRAQDRADEITIESTEDKKHRQKKQTRKDYDTAYDGAMESATRGCKDDKSIKSFII